MKTDQNYAVTASLEVNNNNPELKHTRANASNFTRFVERLLFLLENQYLIVPNGGSGDCMFKAVCQAVYRGEEVKHKEIRGRVVDFVVQERWEKFKESVEVQHISGNQALTRKWKADPVKAYLSYMSSPGTLGASSELNAAGELFRYNFATIQEYSGTDGKTYRVENCCHFDEPDVPFHCFFFTGDFDNGHWEYLKPLDNYSSNEHLIDGVYEGVVTTVIDGHEDTVTNWLRVNTDNTNEVSRLRYVSDRFPQSTSPYPFEWDAFQYEPNGSVSLQGDLYTISKVGHTDLFSVLANKILDKPRNDDIDEVEFQILTNRVDNFGGLNHKIITQPHSHGFNLVNFKYLSMPCKGNIQDLLSAADIMGFSFQVFIKPSSQADVQVCKFIHIDRWGEEASQIENFFMRVYQPSAPQQIFSKWWYLRRTDGADGGRTERQNDELDETNRNISPIGDGCDKVDDDGCVKGPITPEHVEMTSTKPEVRANDRATMIPVPDEKASFENNLALHSKGSKEGNSTSDIINDLLRLSIGTQETSATVVSRTTNGLDAAKKQNTSLNASSVSQSHANVLAGRRTIPIASKRIEKLPQIEINADPSVINDSATIQVPNKGMQDSRKIKTIIEMYDDKTKRRKKYVYHGFVSKEKVLQSLFQQGLITDPLKYDTQVNKGLDLDGQQNNNRIVPTMKKSKKSVAMLKDSRTAIDPENTMDESSYPDTAKKQSASVIALVDDESIVRTSKFLEMHSRVSPVEKKPENSDVLPKVEVQVVQGCFRRFLSWLLLKFRNTK